MIQQRDSFPTLTHGFKAVDSFLLVVAKFKGLAFLCREIVLYRFQVGSIAEERVQLVLNAIGLVFELIVHPAVDHPALISKAVLLQQVVDVLVLGNLARVMVGFAVYLYRDFIRTAQQRKINVSRLAVDVGKRVLNKVCAPRKMSSLCRQPSAIFLRKTARTHV